MINTRKERERREEEDAKLKRREEERIAELRKIGHFPLRPMKRDVYREVVKSVRAMVNGQVQWVQQRQNEPVRPPRQPNGAFRPHEDIKADFSRLTARVDTLRREIASTTNSLNLALVNGADSSPIAASLAALNLELEQAEPILMGLQFDLEDSKSLVYQEQLASLCKKELDYHPEFIATIRPLLDAWADFQDAWGRIAGSSNARGSLIHTLNSQYGYDSRELIELFAQEADAAFQVSNERRDKVLVALGRSDAIGRRQRAMTREIEAEREKQFEAEQAARKVDLNEGPVPDDDE